MSKNLTKSLCSPQMAGAILLVLATFFTGRAEADTLIASQTNTYAFGSNPAAVSIFSEVFNQGSDYLWKYTVTNNSYDPIPGTSNGFSGFELALSVFVPDLGNQTAPNPSWIDDCCSGQPVEWDIRDSVGPGIMPGSSGVFGFTTAPRLITTAKNGWFHTCESDVQTDLVFYGVDNAPLAPDLIAPPISATPEPSSLLLFGTGLLSLQALLRRRFSRLRA